MTFFDGLDLFSDGSDGEISDTDTGMMDGIGVGVGVGGFAKEGCEGEAALPSG